MKVINFFLPRIEYILFMAIFWGLAASGPRILNFDGDLPRHLLLGQLIRETRSVSTTDTFSFRTQGFPSIPHEWLSQVMLSIANDLLGLSGVVLLTAILVTLTWAIVFHEARRRSKQLLVSLIVTAIGVAASLIHVLPRPHLFTYLLTALWLAVLERIRENKTRRWWLLPVLMIFWVNLHGMFVLGIAIIGIYLLGSFLESPSAEWFRLPSSRSMLLGGLLSLFATFLSPSGFHIWSAIASLGSNAYITSHIPEYQSPDFHVPETWPFVLLLVLTILAFGRNTNKTAWTHILLAVSFAAIALYTSRMIPLFAIVIAPITAEGLASLLRQEFPQSRFLVIEKNISALNATSNGIIWILLLVTVVTVLFKAGRAIDPANKGNVFATNFFPVQAVNWLNSHPQKGHMFNEFDWGGYLLLKLSPRQQIFMDGHTHIYGEALTREYETVLNPGKGWEKIFEKYEITWAIIRRGRLLAGELIAQGWEPVYQDETTIVLIRK